MNEAEQKKKELRLASARLVISQRWRERRRVSGSPEKDLLLWFSHRDREATSFSLRRGARVPMRVCVGIASRVCVRAQRGKARM